MPSGVFVAVDPACPILTGLLASILGVILGAQGGYIETIIGAIVGAVVFATNGGILCTVDLAAGVDGDRFHRDHRARTRPAQGVSRSERGRPGPGWATIFIAPEGEGAELASSPLMNG